MKSSKYALVIELVSDIDKLKESILRFASSELTNHAANFIGLSIILFTVLNVAILRFPRVPLKFEFPNPCQKSTWDFFIIFVILWTLVTGMIFAIGRIAFYGTLAHETIEYPSQGIIISEGEKISLKELHKKIADKVCLSKVKLLGLIPFPLTYFKSGIGRASSGLLISFAFGLIVTVLLFLAFFFN